MAKQKKIAEKTTEKDETTEDKKVLREAEMVHDFVKTEVWRIIRIKLVEKISGLSDIMSFEEMEPQKLVVQLAANQEAIKILLEFLNEIEGQAMSSEHYKEQFKEINEEYLKSI